MTDNSMTHQWWCKGQEPCACSPGWLAMTEEERTHSLDDLERALMEHPDPMHAKVFVWTLEDLDAEYNRLLSRILPAFRTSDWIAVERLARELAETRRRANILRQRQSLLNQTATMEATKDSLI